MWVWGVWVGRLGFARTPNDPSLLCSSSNVLPEHPFDTGFGRRAPPGFPGAAAVEGRGWAVDGCGRCRTILQGCTLSEG